jgi:hypothetical protein
MACTLLIALAAGASGLALTLVDHRPAPAAPAAKTVQGSVGPGFTINLTRGGKKVAKLKKAFAIAS